MNEFRIKDTWTDFRIMAEIVEGGFARKMMFVKYACAFVGLPASLLR